MSDDYSGEEEKQGEPHRGFQSFIGREGLIRFSNPQKVLLLEGMIVSYIGRFRET